MDYTDSAVHVEVHVDRRSERGSSKFRLVKFYTAHRTAQGQAQGLYTLAMVELLHRPDIIHLRRLLEGALNILHIRRLECFPCCPVAVLPPFAILPYLR